jgi:hypothetical protein
MSSLGVARTQVISVATAVVSKDLAWAEVIPAAGCAGSNEKTNISVRRQSFIFEALSFTFVGL